MNIDDLKAGPRAWRRRNKSLLPSASAHLIQRRVRDECPQLVSNAVVVFRQRAAPSRFSASTANCQAIRFR